MIDKKFKVKANCVGCYACANTCPVSCIDLQDDVEGFKYPRVDYSKCLKCNRCIDSCPTINMIDVKNNPISYACMNIDDQSRFESSSGGIFSVIAERIIQDGGKVFGAAFDDQLELIHMCVDSSDELKKLKGSKYIQSQIGSTYAQAKAYLDDNINVLFSGTPCQIAGLKRYLNHPYDNLICIDIICHGVPSPMVWKKYIDYAQKKAGVPIKIINFRYKKEGWKKYSILSIYKNDLEHIETRIDNPYMRAFLKKICLRPSCHYCHFKGVINRQSDITLGDFWGIHNVAPHMDDDKGTSLIMISSNKGEALFNQCSDQIRSEKVDIEKSVQYNSAATQSVPTNVNRSNFFSEIDDILFDKLVKKYCSDKMIVRAKRKIRKVVRKIIK